MLKSWFLVNKLMALCRLNGILFVLSHALGKTYTTFVSTVILHFTFLFQQRILIKTKIKFRDEQSLFATFTDYSRNPQCKLSCSQHGRTLIYLLMSLELLTGVFSWPSLLSGTSSSCFPLKSTIFSRIQNTKINFFWESSSEKNAKAKYLPNKDFVFRFSLFIPLLQLCLDLTVDKLFGFNDILMQDCLDIRPDTDVRDCRDIIWIISLSVVW